MMKDWEDFRYALALARYGSMVSAAAALGVTAATVSRHIDRVSAASGVQIFELRGSRWEVSSAGAPIIRAAERIEAEIAEAQAHTRSGTDVSGKVVINTVSFVNNFFLAPKLDALLLANPALLPVLDATDRNVSLAHGEADVSIRLLRPDKGRLIRVPISSFPIGIFGPPGADRRHWVGLPEWLDWLPEMVAGYRHFGKPPAIRVDSFPGLAKAARATNLMTIFPTCIASAFDDLVPYAADAFAAERQAWCVYHENNRGSAKIRAVTDWIRAVLKPGQCACGLCGAGPIEPVAPTKIKAGSYKN